MLAYLDCFSGISGDMTIGAMIDLGLDPALLAAEVKKLGPIGVRTRVWRDRRKGVAGVRFDVEIESDQPHRSYGQICALIEKSGLAPEPKGLALKIFDVLAQAEAHVHGVEKADVHFHEIGAVDSIVDVVGAAVGFHALGIRRTVCSPLPLGRGFVRTGHGIMPTPAPAALEILKGIPVVPCDEPMELVTPTGAAIVKAIADEFGEWPAFTPIRVGYGLGTSDRHDTPNALRIAIGEDHPIWGEERVAILECQVDDLDPRLLGSLMNDLLANGALDVFFTPIYMKKNRPGNLVTVLARLDLVSQVALTLFGSTSTLGIRVSESKRFALSRRSLSLETTFGAVKVKHVVLPDLSVELRPEFDDVKRIAQARGMFPRQILQALQRELAGKTVERAEED